MPKLPLHIHQELPLEIPTMGSPSAHKKKNESSSNLYLLLFEDSSLSKHGAALLKLVPLIQCRSKYEVLAVHRHDKAQ